MFELSVAWKYLIPRRRQLSVSIISVLSVAVIAMVVWLVLVFFSVTTGLEKSWTEKLVTMTAPIRISPTPAYYNSYYYNIDSLSFASDYTFKSIGEKLEAPQTDPYDPYFDIAPPDHWKHEDNRDIVKETFDLIRSIDGITPSEYRYAIGQLKLEFSNDDSHTVLNQACYLSSYDHHNINFQKVITESKNIEPHKALPYDNKYGNGIVVAKFIKDSGSSLGDRGHISYYAGGPGGWQEQRIPIHVAGFYDPGIMPLGGKILIVDKDIVNLAGSSSDMLDSSMGNGINIWFEDFSNAKAIKNKIINKLKAAELDEYWKVQTYQEYEFTKDIVEQLQSEKNLFMVIAVIIMAVACSNIISMLIILVNDKKKEIGILQSMGATSYSIAIIFGLCGLIMGLAATIVGTAAALATLSYLPQLLEIINNIQGHELLNSAFYGDYIPNTLNFAVLRFVIISTVIISILAGLIPAIKASLIKPASALRSAE